MAEKYDLCMIETSNKKDKKYDAKFREKGCPCSKSAPPECGKKEKIVSFGAKGYDDYTTTPADQREEKKSLYLARHKAREDWNNPTTPGSLSRWILWNKKTLKASIADFKKRFNL